ncbi:MAG: DDE-type integrase/transposase/recombinase [Acidimicrobiales bacterium]
MLPKEKAMEVLEAYDLTKSFRSAAQLTGVDHHTVARLVAARAIGAELSDEPAVRSKVAEAFADKIAEWIDRSGGRIRADVVHDKLVAMGYEGSERTTRRVVAALKASYVLHNHRIYKPWITEPGAWLQYDFGDGPVIGGVAAILFCAWLAWSRFRVIIPLADKSLPSVIAALDRTFRIVGGLAPTYVLTDNERTVTDRHIAGIALRNRMALDVSRYYGITIATCVPYDPESKAWATDCTSCWDGWEDVVDWVKDHGRRRTRTHPAACRRAA